MLHLIAAAPPAGPSPIISLMPMVLIFAIFYVIWFLPIRRKQKALDQLLAALKKGDRVVTSGGIYGEIAAVDNQIVVLKISDHVKIRVARRAITGLEETPGSKAGDEK